MIFVCQDRGDDGQHSIRHIPNRGHPRGIFNNGRCGEKAGAVSFLDDK